MGNLGHQAARLAASKICDNIVKGLCKDPETEVVKLIDMWQKFMGDEKIDLNYDSARKMICDKDCTLNKYMHRLINEIDPHVLKTIALNLGLKIVKSMAAMCHGSFLWIRQVPAICTVQAAGQQSMATS